MEHEHQYQAVATEQQNKHESTHSETKTTFVLFCIKCGESKPLKTK